MEEPEASDPEPKTETAGPSQDERTWALVVHLGSTIISLVSGGTIGWILPLVVYLAKRDESDFVADQSKEALNFRLTLLIGYLLCIPLYFVVIGFCFAIVLWLAELILGIIAAIRSYDGERYRYPFAFRLIS